MGVLPGIIGSMQAMEVVKLLLGVGRSLVGRLLIFDGLDMSWREVALRRNPECPVCGDEPTQTGLIDYEVFCGLAPADDGGSSPATNVGGPDSGAVATATTVASVDAPELAARLDGDDPPFMLDVREPWEWAVGNLGGRGARLVPLAELEDRLAELPRERPIVVYCKSGQRSATAARLLSDRGFPSVTHLEGGIAAWARQIEPDLAVP